MLPNETNSPYQLKLLVRQRFIRSHALRLITPQPDHLIAMSIAPSRTMACDFHKVRPEIALGLELYTQIVGDQTGPLSFLPLGVEE